MYALHSVDRAGNDCVVAKRNIFWDLLYMYDKYSKEYKENVHYIVNEDQVDVDFDGLTDEEREAL